MSLRMKSIPRFAFGRPQRRLFASQINSSASVAQNQFPVFPSPDAEQVAEQELEFAAHNYEPIPVVLSHGRGAVVTDVDGKEYLDFLSAYSAVNQGHCHPEIIATLQQQSQRLTLTSRAFHHDVFLPYAKFMTETFGFDKVLPMNTGVEGGETAVKLARRWGYRYKGIPQNQAEIVFAKNNFWGRTLAAISTSNDPESFSDFGPFVPGFSIVDYDNLEALETKFKADHKMIAAFMVEPIQGEAGVVVPKPGYIAKAKALCDKYNILFIADEVQTGLCRTGKLLCCDHDGIKPDILILGKALGGGVYPCSAVLTSDEVMQYITPGSHGSTFGGNPLACAIAISSVEVLLKEKLAERAEKLGNIFRAELSELKKLDHVEEIRGKGLLNAMIVKPKVSKTEGVEPITAWELCLKLAERGVLAKPTHGNIIRFAPPLVISEKQLQHGLDVIKTSTRELFG